ncbi:hypothetical protein T01_15905 [Trichinella spiralis]|uniref:Uncharacterized protein n=1 Tax=Trichinella spiralis TaxID=6334 RepID=A0A0V1ASV4_TRISP|nr:hypothetical protein T01_13899 [Trichinella spiralis]KRY27895.1 hypothetical protein T01_15905 [Trichinella spiralis]
MDTKCRWFINGFTCENDNNRIPQQHDQHYRYHESVRIMMIWNRGAAPSQSRVSLKLCVAKS